MAYTVIISPHAERDLRGIRGEIYERLKSAILALADEPRPSNCLKLKGRDA